MKIASGRDGRKLNAYLLDGDGMKDIPLTAVSSSDIERWFRNGTTTAKDPTQYYERVVTLFRCVEHRASSLATMPRQIESVETGQKVATANFPSPQFDDDGKPLTEENLPFEIDLDDLLWRTELAQCLLAASYWHVLKNRVKVTEVRWLDPRTISPNYTRYKGLVSFGRTANGINKTIPVEEMAYVWRPGLQELGPGVAPGQVAARKAGIADNMDSFIEIFFEKGAMPTMVVFAETRPEEPERKRIKSYLEKIMTGIGNAFGIEVLNSSLKFQTLTPPLKDMIIPNIEDSAQKGIVVALLGGAGSAVIGGSANFATAEVEDINFYNKIMIPEANLIFQKPNKTFFKSQGLRLVARPDLLEVFQRQESRKVLDATRLFDRGAITADELRQAAGYQPSTAQEKQEALTGLVDLAQATETQTGALGEAERTREKEQEVRRWERKVLKRFPDVPPYAIPFAPEHLTSQEAIAIRQALLTAGTAEEVKAAFAAPFRPERPFRVHARVKSGSSSG